MGRKSKSKAKKLNVLELQAKMEELSLASGTTVTTTYSLTGEIDKSGVGTVTGRLISRTSSTSIPNAKAAPSSNANSKSNSLSNSTQSKSSGINGATTTTAPNPQKNVSDVAKATAPTATSTNSAPNPKGSIKKTDPSNSNKRLNNNINSNNTSGIGSRTATPTPTGSVKSNSELSTRTRSVTSDEELDEMDIVGFDQMALEMMHDAEMHLGNCPCPCCGEEGDDEVDVDLDLDLDLDLDSGTDWEECDFSEESQDKRHQRVRMLLMQNARAKIVLQKSKNYNRVLTTQKTIRQQQLYVLQRANSLNSMFVKNMEGIMKLSFCPMVIQPRTDHISKGLVDIHRMIHDWDDKLEDLILKSQNKKSTLNSLFQVFSDKFGKQIDSLSDKDFKEVCEQLGDLPDLLSDEQGLEDAIKEIDVDEVHKEWESFEQKIETRLYKMETEFISLCVEYGIRTNLPRVSGYEWAHAVGNSDQPRKLKESRSRRVGTAVRATGVTILGRIVQDTILKSNT